MLAIKQPVAIFIAAGRQVLTAFAITLAVCFCACGKGAEEPPSAATTPAPTATVQPTPTTEPTLTLPAAPVDPFLDELFIVNADGTGLRPIHSQSSVWELWSSIWGVSWSPSGKKLAFVTTPDFASWASGGSEIHIVEADDEATHLLQRVDGFVGGLMWSPTGEWLALEREFRDTSGRLQEAGVDLLSGDGADLRRLHRGVYPETIVGWSPDGGTLLVLSGDLEGELLVIDIASGESRSLTEQSVLRWYGAGDLSPDGTTVAFVSKEEGTETCDCAGYCMSLSIVNIDGSGVKQLLQPTCNLRDVAWSRDGRRLAYTILGFPENGVYVLDVVTGAVMRLTQPEEGFDAYVSWLPDGDSIVARRLPCTACDASGYQAVLVPVAGGREERVLARALVGGSSPDGQWYAYGTYRGNGLWLAPIAGGEELTLVAGAPDFDLVEIAWSPDGRRLAFVHKPSYGVRRYVVNVDGSDLTRLPLRLQGGFLSPDGQNVAFLKWELKWEDGDSLWVANADGSDEKHIADSSGRPVWSPDGRRLAYDSSGQVWVFDVETGKSAAVAGVAPDATFTSFEWSPDGGHLAYESSRQVSVLDLQTGEAAVVGPAGHLLEWSPDSSHLAYRSFVLADGGTPRGQLWGPSGTPLAYASKAVSVLDVHTGEAAVVVPGDYHWEWSPHGRRIASCREGALYVISADGSGERKLTESARGGNPVWSPDGRQLAVLLSDVDRPGIYIVNADGSGLAELVSATQGDYYDIAWSDDGARLFFTSEIWGM